MKPSARAEIITRRTYCRPLNDEGTIFETWEQVIDRVIGHQKWLWERALTHNVLPDMPLHDVSEDLTEWVHLDNKQIIELEELRQLMIHRKALPSGRCFTGDTKVKLLDGTSRRFDDLEKGVMYWAYGCKEDGEIVPVEALFNGVTRSEHSYAKVVLDNGEEIKCTTDHPFMLADGSYKEAKDLLPSDSLMPLYTKEDKNGYELTYTQGKWIKTYKLVKDSQNEDFSTPNGQCKIIHHANFNKKDNTPENLVYMGDQDHFALHNALGKENVKKMNDLIWNHPDYKKFREDKAIQCGKLGKAVWSEDKYAKTRDTLKLKSSERAIKRNKTDKQKQALKDFRNTEEGKNISLTNLEKANKDNYGLKVKLFKQAKHLISIGLEINEDNWKANKLYKNAMGFHVISKYFNSYEQFEEELSLYNHNIVSVEIIESNTIIDFYDFSVPKTVNFALDAGIFVHNTLWLGGTSIAKKRESSMFNCSHSEIETMYDVVDVFWLLLQGCGIGATPKVGTLNGFRKVIPNIQVIRSTRTEKGGRASNEETFAEGVWHISVGDSAEAWAKAVGKLLAGKYKAHTLILDFSQIRPAGERLKGYGWISSGDGPFSEALPKIASILNHRAGGLLRKLDIIEVLNLLGTVLSSRRSAEIMLMDYESDEWEDFAKFKNNCYEEGFKHKQQSNNSLVFNHRPSRPELDKIFQMMIDAGGSEPGFFNGQTAKKRAPWFSGTNPSLRKGTLVYTDKGILPIESLQDREFKVKTIENESKDALCKLSGKNKYLHKITLVGGHEYYCTPEHQWPIFRKGYNTSRDNWSTVFKCPTNELVVGDCLPIIRNKELYPLGSKFTYTQGFLIGWLQGDGWVTKRSDNGNYQVGFIVSSKEVEIIPIIEKAISKYSQAKFKNRGSSYELNTQNSGLYDYIKELGFIDKDNIPSSLYDCEVSDDFRKGFLDGIFSSDGSVEKTTSGSHLRVCLTSSRGSFIKQMSEFIGFYGIRSNITTGTSTLPGYTKVYHRSDLRFSNYEDIKHFSCLLNLSVKHKQDRLDTITIPKRIVLHNMIKIKSVELTDIFEDVWDIGVRANDHTFQLAHCITGNCGEILLGNKSFCNLVEIDVGKFVGDSAGLHKATTLIARANYRQTIVDLRDGVLQESWHKNNEFLRLCGVGATGIAKRDDMTEYDWKNMKYSAVTAARTMSNELGLEWPKNVTTVNKIKLAA